MRSRRCKDYINNFAHLLITKERSILTKENSTKGSFDPCSVFMIPVGMQASHSPPEAPSLQATVSLKENQPSAKIADA